jgi:hypothetical protein
VTERRRAYGWTHQGWELITHGRVPIALRPEIWHQMFHDDRRCLRDAGPAEPGDLTEEDMSTHHLHCLHGPDGRLLCATRQMASAGTPS